MKIIIAPDSKQAGCYAGSLLVPLFTKIEPVRLGLATGKTMIGVYQSLIRQLAAMSLCPVAHVSTFNLDEYWQVPPNHPGSFQYFMHRYLFTDLPPFLEQIHFLRGDAEKAEDECRRFDTLLSQEPVDTQLLGIGVNGHIGFNEPGTSFSSRTRKVQLSPSTIKRNALEFPGVMPKAALSVGIANIMEANNVILVACGEDKSHVLSQALCGSVREECPASILQTHPKVTVIVDKMAAQSLIKYFSRHAIQPLGHGLSIVEID